MLRNLGRSRTAILTGWAVDSNCRYRHQCDAAFPLSDHADFPDLLELVNRVQPKKVYTLHGFAADFAQTLRARGVDAQALSQDEQLALGFITNQPEVKSQVRKRAVPLAPRDRVAGDETPLPGSFLGFALTCVRIGSDTRKLEKIRILSEYLRGLRGEALRLTATWFTGLPFAATENKVLQLGWALLRDALATASGLDAAVFHEVYLKHSDLGETAAELLEHHPVQPALTLEQLGDIFNELQAARGPLAKAPILRAALERCTPIEAKYVVKIITGDLRIGLKEGLVEEAVATAFSKPADDIRQANLMLGDVGETARLAAEDRLSQVQLVPFRPVKFMLASPEETAAEVWKRVQGRAPVTGSNDPGSESGSVVLLLNGISAAAWVEDKYDGIRCQLHKVGGRVAMYSRDLKDITATFPEIASAVAPLNGNFILDGELIAMRGDAVLPFSDLQKRLGRRQDDLFMREEMPISLVAFDCLWSDGATLMDRPLQERRLVLEGVNPRPACLRVAEVRRIHSAAEIEAEFTAARNRGNEGLVIKNALSRYSPGRRGLAWLKLKKALATLDCVVVGAEYGHGKRSKVLSDYTFAVRDEQSGELKTIGKAYTGLTDAEIGALTEHFLGTAIRRHGRYFEVAPDTVLEIAFDRLQLSDRHSSGLAMRFPRIVRIRTDKTSAEIDTVESARRLLPVENPD
jgi:DNA ligase-1